jgi:glycosyltransferase involved in cell wall biosynthesis
MPIILSIIIPCYNHGKYLHEALQSIKNCGETPYQYEIIIVNDGSTDQPTIEVLSQLNSEGYTIINQPNKGLGAARNAGIRLAKGKYILPIDSDNKIKQPYLTTAIEAMEKDNSIAVVYGDAKYFGEKDGQWNVGGFNLQKLMLGNYIDACAVIRKEVINELGGYDEKMPIMGSEDWDLWLRIAIQGHKFFYISEVVFEYRVLGNSMVRSNKEKKAILLDEYMLKKHKDYLSPEDINRQLIENLKERKGLAIKLFLKLYFPSVINYLVKQKKIQNDRVL